MCARRGRASSERRAKDGIQCRTVKAPSQFYCDTAMAPRGERHRCGRKSKACCPNPVNTLD